MTTLLFIGDIVGPGLDFLEQHLPSLIQQHDIHLVVANAENLELPPMKGRIICGMSPASLNRLFALGVDLVTGGNHSWDGPYGREVHQDGRVLRPLNYQAEAPGRGSAIINKGGVRLHVINLVSRDALPYANEPLQALERELAAQRGNADVILVDVHGASNEEKLSIAHAVDGRVTAVFGTHTHVPTMDAQRLPRGTAYCSDVGMTGPSGGILGYHPQKFVATLRQGVYDDSTYAYADGPAQLGAVLVKVEGGLAVQVTRLPTPA
jgi:hypothetical protein